MEKPKYYIDITKPEVVERLHEACIEILKTTKIPNYAFIVCQVLKRKHLDIDNPIITTSIQVINMEDQPDQEYILNDVLKRGGKYVCYGNFPTFDDPIPERRDKWKNYAEPGGANPWDNMALLCNQLEGHALEVSSEVRKYKEGLEEAILREEEKEKEIQALKAQLAKATKVDTAKDTKGTQAGGQNG